MIYIKKSDFRQMLMLPGVRSSNEYKDNSLRFVFWPYLGMGIWRRAAKVLSQNTEDVRNLKEPLNQGSVKMSSFFKRNLSSTRLLCDATSYPHGFRSPHPSEELGADDPPFTPRPLPDIHCTRINELNVRDGEKNVSPVGFKAGHLHKMCSHFIH